MKSRFSFSIISLLSLIAIASVCLAGYSNYLERKNWGDLSGRIVESANPNVGVANVIVFLRPTAGSQPPIHHSHSDLEDQPVFVSILPSGLDTEFVLLWNKRELHVANKNLVPHDVHPITFLSNERAILPPGDFQRFRFSKGDKTPGMLCCDVNPIFEAPMMICDHPYMAVTDENGEFEIENIPVGNWDFVFWSKDAGYMRELIVEGSKVGRRGDKQIQIKGLVGTDIGTATWTPKR